MDPLTSDDYARNLTVREHVMVEMLKALVTAPGTKPPIDHGKAEALVDEAEELTSSLLKRFGCSDV